MANGTAESDKFSTDGPGTGKQDSEPENMDQDMNAENVDEEYVALEETLNQLDSCLDDLEEKNDSLNAKLRELLDTSEEGHAAETSGEKDGAGADKDNSHIPKDSKGARR